MKISPLPETIAYFSMDVAVSCEIPTYSGGLGVLAGDMLRSAADLNVPMVAVSLIHRKGYFDQRLDPLGNQLESPAKWTPENHLIKVAPTVSVSIEGRQVHVAAWQYTFTGITGHSVPLYFLDTDLEENDSSDSSYTNVCVTRCKFCNFYRPPTNKTEGYVLTREQLTQKFQETVDLGGVQILLQGGLNPKLPIGWYEDLFRWMKASFPLAIHGLSPEEIRYIAEIENMSIRAGDRAADRRRPRFDPGRRRRDPRRRDPLPDLAAQVLDRHLAGGDARGARRWGCARRRRWCSASARQPRHIVNHFERLRALQDQTAGFTAFICWPFQAEGTRLKLRDDTTAMRYLRVFALARLYLDNFPSLQVSWPTMGPEVGQVALRFGGNDFGSAMIEENVVSQAGAIFKLGADDIERYIRGRRLHAAPPQHALRAAGGRLARPGECRREGRERALGRSDRARRRSPKARSRSPTTARCWRSARRAEVRAEFPDAPEERAEGVLLPGLVNAHSHLELSALRRRRPGRQGPVRLGDDADERPQGRHRRARSATAAAARGRRGRRARHRGDRRRRQRRSRPRPASAAAGLRRRAVSRAVRLARGSRPATRWPTPRASAPRRAAGLAGAASATCPRRTRPTPSVPSCCARIFAAAAAAGRADVDPRRRGRRRAGAAARRLRALARRCSPAWASIRRRACPRKSPVAYLASLGAFQTETPPLLVHMVHAGADDRRLAREAGATVVLCPRSNLHIGGRLPDVGALRRRRRAARRSAPTASPPSPDLSLWAEMATLAAHFPSVHGRALAGRRHARRRARPGPARVRHAHAGRTSRRARRARRRRRRAAGIAGARSEPRRCAGWRRRHDAPRRVNPGREIRTDDQVRAHAVRAAVRARRRGDRGARPRPFRSRASPASSSRWPARAPPRWASTGSSTATSTRRTRAPPDASCPAGAISLRAAWALTIAASAVFVGAAAALGPLCLALAPVALAILFGYSLTKRFTALCHLFLGLAIAGGPAGAWIAVRGDFGWAPGLLMLAVGCWIAGFDILYALADRDFDRATRPALDPGAPRRHRLAGRLRAAARRHRRRRCSRSRRSPAWASRTSSASRS